MSETPQLDFDALTPAQRRALGAIAFGGSYHHPKVLAALLKLEMIEAVEQQSADRLGTFKWTEYVMPIWVHMQWCAWCALHTDDVSFA